MNPFSFDSEKHLEEQFASTRTRMPRQGSPEGNLRGCKMRSRVFMRRRSALDFARLGAALQAIFALQVAFLFYEAKKFSNRIFSSL